MDELLFITTSIMINICCMYSNIIMIIIRFWWWMEYMHCAVIIHSYQHVCVLMGKCVSVYVCTKCVCVCVVSVCVY